MTELKTRTIGGLVFTAQELTPFTVLDLMPELAEIAAPAITAATDAASIGMIGRALGRGKLRELLPRLLQGVSVTIQEGGKPQRMTLNTVDAINVVFAGRMGALPGVLVFAAEVSFGELFASLKELKELSRSNAPAST